jgi:hypothetical protein
MPRVPDVHASRAACAPPLGSKQVPARLFPGPPIGLGFDVIFDSRHFIGGSLSFAFSDLT